MIRKETAMTPPMTTPARRRRRRRRGRKEEEKEEKEEMMGEEITDPIPHLAFDETFLSIGSFSVNCNSCVRYVTLSETRLLCVLNVIIKERCAERYREEREGKWPREVEAVEFRKEIGRGGEGERRFRKRMGESKRVSRSFVGFRMSQLFFEDIASKSRFPCVISGGESGDA